MLVGSNSSSLGLNNVTVDRVSASFKENLGENRAQESAILAVQMLDKLLNVGAEINTVKYVNHLLGSWTVTFYPDGKNGKIGLVEATLATVDPSYFSLRVRGEPYAIHSVEDIDIILPASRESFLARFHLPERTWAADLPKYALRDQSHRR
jgi:hypothetical protein